MVFSKIESQMEEEKCVVRYGESGGPMFCFIDYDRRSHDINMGFQHFHKFYELFILISEQAVHAIEGDYYDLQQYDIVCLKPGVLHKTFYEPGTPSTRLIIQFQVNAAGESQQENLERLTKVFDEIQPIYRFQPGQQEQLMILLRDLVKENVEQPGKAPLTSYSLILEFLRQLNLCKSGNQYENREKVNETDKRIYEISSFIHANYARDLSLEMLAERFFLSSSHLSRRFHKITGFKLIEYIQRTRLRNAQQKLVFTSERISVIAEQCGFTSFSQFSRVFRQYYKVSPTDYRKNYKHNDVL